MSFIIHELKSIEPYFSDVWYGSKTFEVRINDRDFQAGQKLLLKSYDEVLSYYLPKEILCTISYIMRDSRYIKEGYVILGINNLKRYNQGRLQ